MYTGYSTSHSVGYSRYSLYGMYKVYKKYHIKDFISTLSGILSGII